LESQEALREVERAAQRRQLPGREVDMQYLKNTILQLYTKGARWLMCAAESVRMHCAGDQWHASLRGASDTQGATCAACCASDLWHPALQKAIDCQGPKHIACCATGEMRALLPVLATMLKFSPADTDRCQESAAKWETAAGAEHLAAIRWRATLMSRRSHQIYLRSPHLF